MNLSRHYEGIGIRNIVIGVFTETIWALVVLLTAFIFGTILLVIHNIGWF